MKAIQYQAYGDFAENRLVELPRPQLGDAAVLVEMHTVGVNPLDNTFRSGAHYAATPQNLPRIGGQTGVGVVVETQSKDFGVGDRVFVRRPGAGLLVDGTWREVLEAPPEILSHIPDEVDDDHAAAFMAGYGYLTGYLGLTELAHFNAGQSVLAPAIGSAVGMETVQVARRLGASLTISTAGSTQKAERARADGYEHVIDLSRESLKDGVLRITEGKGVDVIVDGVQRIADRPGAGRPGDWGNHGDRRLRRGPRSHGQRDRHHLEGGDNPRVHLPDLQAGNPRQRRHGTVGVPRGRCTETGHREDLPAGRGSGRRPVSHRGASLRACPHDNTMLTVPGLDWKLLTRKRGGSTRDIPPGNEGLAWVTNTVTPISRDRDAVLVDTLLRLPCCS